MTREDERRRIGERIAALRRSRGLTQRQLAGIVGVSERAVQSWEQGRSHPYRHLQELERSLGVTAADLGNLDADPQSLLEEFRTTDLRDRIEEAPNRRSRLSLQDLDRRLRAIEERLASLEPPSE
jgi:transcriptional regulator with XRE-family HTH domain